MEELNTTMSDYDSLFDDCSTHSTNVELSAAMKCFSSIISELEYQLNDENKSSFSNAAIDIIVFVLGLFQRILKLRSKSGFLNNLLIMYDLPIQYSSSVQSNTSTLSSELTEPKHKSCNTTIDISALHVCCEICDEKLDCSWEEHIRSPYHVEIESLMHEIQECQLSEESKVDRLENSAVNCKIDLDLDCMDLLEPSSFSQADNSRQSNGEACSRKSTTSISVKKDVTSSTKSQVGSFLSKSRDHLPVERNPCHKGSSVNKELVLPSSKNIRAFSSNSSSCSSVQKPSSTTSKPVVFSKSILNSGKRLFDRSSWIKDNHQTELIIETVDSYFCILCNAILPNPHNFDNHVSSYNHKYIVRCLRAQSSTGSKAPKTVSVHKNESEVIIKVNGIRYCTLCDVKMPSEHNFEMHIRGNVHQRKLELFVRSHHQENSNSSNHNIGNNLTISTVRDPFVVNKEGIQSCIICNVKFAGKSQLDSHLNESFHRSKIGLYEVVKKSTKIINGLRYCALCDVQLPGQSQMDSHFSGSSHKSEIICHVQRYVDKKY